MTDEQPTPFQIILDDLLVITSDYVTLSDSLIEDIIFFQRMRRDD